MKQGKIPFNVLLSDSDNTVLESLAQTLGVSKGAAVRYAVRRMWEVYAAEDRAKEVAELTGELPFVRRK